MSKSMLPFILREPFVSRKQDHSDESVYEFFRRRLSKEVCLYFTANEYISVWTIWKSYYEVLSEAQSWCDHSYGLFLNQLWLINTHLLYLIACLLWGILRITNRKWQETDQLAIYNKCIGRVELIQFRQNLVYFKSCIVTTSGHAAQM